MNLHSCGSTDIGRRRRRNEDAFLDDPSDHLYAVADGLGGLSGGDRASRLAISILKAHQKEALNSGRALDFRQAFADAHKAIQKLGSQLDPVLGSGTTLTVALVQDDRIDLAHIGDSAAYLFRSDDWEKLSTDHTEAEVLRKKAPGQPVPPMAEHTLTRCLGQPGDVETDFHTYPVHKGDRLLLCTDGATRHIQPDEIAEWTRAAQSPRELVDEVIKLANRRGGSDNVTAVAIFID